VASQLSSHDNIKLKKKKNL